MAATEELKIVISAEEKASKEVDRLTSKLKAFQGRMKNAFNVPITSGFLNTKAIETGFAKYGAGLNQINERHTRMANGMRRSNQMTMEGYNKLNDQLGTYITKQGTVRRLNEKQAEEFVNLTRKVRAYEQVWNRQHERYLSGLSRERQIFDQVERAKDRLGNLGFQNESRRRKAMDTATASLARQRSRAYIAQIREQERAGNALGAQRTRAYLSELRTQESARRSLEGQRSRAYAAEERRKQQLRNASWAQQMRDEARGRREQERDEARRHRGLQQAAGRGASAAASIPGQLINGAFTTALVATAATIAVKKFAEHGIESRMRTDTAEANLRMFGGNEFKTKESISELRTSFLNGAAIDNGFKPAAALNAFTEVIKAGIPADFAKQVTSSIMAGSAGLDLNVTDTTKLVGRLATLTQDPNKFDAGAIDKMLNGIAVVAKVTAADSNELVSSLRRGAGVLGSSKMSVQDLTAFTGVGISAGMQEGKAGTFMDFMVNELVNAKNSRGQRRADLTKFGQLSGVGNVQSITRQAANDPTKLLLKIVDKIAKSSPEKAGQMATLLGMREWRGELLQLSKAAPMLHKAIDAERDPANKDHLSDAKTLRMGTMRGLLSQIGAVSEQLWEAVGVGLEGPFRQITQFFVDFGKDLNPKIITDHIAVLVEGFVSGLGFNSIPEVMEAIFGKAGDFDFNSLGKWLNFGKGFGRAIRDFIDTITGLLPKGGIKPADLAYWTATIGAWSMAITAARPAIDLISTMASVITSLGVAVIGARAGITLLGMMLGGGTAAGVGTGVAGAAGAAGLTGLLGAAAIPVTIAAIAAGAVAMFWGKEALKGSFLGIPSGKGGEPDMRNAPMSGGELGGSLNIRPRVQRQSFEGDSPLAGLIHKAAYTGYDDRGDNVRDLSRTVSQMGARFQLASLSGGSMGAGAASVLSGMG
ncbi:phage tail tape measure protein, partial [Methylobacterium sp. WL120]|uniref:phage tail tape measure protein n=1 Tax=Methylobacterium sp. WL120 TaxID=2603887 RepID=UPI0011DC1B88